MKHSTPNKYEKYGKWPPWMLTLARIAWDTSWVGIAIIMIYALITLAIIGAYRIT